MFISFGKINIKWILFLLVPLLIFFISLIESKSNSDENLFFFPFLRFLARSLSCILWIVLYKSLQFQNVRKKNKENSIKLNESLIINSDEVIETQRNRVKTASEVTIYSNNLDNNLKQINDNIIIKNKTNNKIMILTGILDFIATTVKYIFIHFKYRDKVSGGLTVLSSCSRLMFITLLSYFFLYREKLGKHQLFSAGVILVTVIIITILSFYMEDEENNDKFILKLTIMFTPEILYCFMYISGAFFLIRTQGNIYKLVFFNGIIGMVLSGVLQLFILLLKCDDLDNVFVKDFKFCDGENIETISVNFKSFKNFGGFLTILLIIINFIEIICIWLIIYYFSINHFAAIFIINSFFGFISKRNKFSYKIIYIIGCLIIIIMALIYNEIIILKFCGFDQNTQIEIRKRAITESTKEYDIKDDKRERDTINSNTSGGNRHLSFLRELSISL